MPKVDVRVVSVTGRSWPAGPGVSVFPWCTTELLPRSKASGTAGRGTVLPIPGLTNAVDNYLSQQQLRQPMPGSHQAHTDILTSPHQIMAGFLLDSGDRQRADLAHPGCAIVPDDLLTSVRQA